MKSEKQVQLFLLFIAVVTGGCGAEEPKKADEDALQKLWSKTRQVSGQALEQVSKLETEDAKREFKKLSQFEYRVIPFPRDVNPTELQSSLGTLGEEGFDCSTPILRESDLLITCKRKPESLLRYVPPGLLGKSSW
jgi:hypothetical protein